MNYPTVRFVFDRKHVASRTKKGLVQIEILFQRRRKWIGTGIKLFAHQWNDARHIINSPTVLEDNETLDTMMANVKSILHGIIKDTGGFSFGLFEDRFRRANNQTTFMDYMCKFIARSNRSESRKMQYQSAYLHLGDYIKIRKLNLYFEDFTPDFVADFDAYLKDCGLRGTTINIYHSILSSVSTASIADGYAISNPYTLFTPERRKSEERDYLSEEELKRFKSVPIKPSKEKYRDFFLIQCYTGLAFSDMMNVDWKNGIEKRGDKFILTGNRIKTGEGYYIVLMKPVLEILAKYDYVLPRFATGTLNNNIREIAKAANIHKRISNHVGRHTFAVFALSNGVPIEVVANILGHADIKTTQIYAKIVNKTVEKNFDMLNNLFEDGLGENR